MPLNPQKILSSSQVRQPPTTTRTPPQMHQYSIYITTPKSSMDIHRAIRTISPTTARMTCRKVAKSVALRDIEIARLQGENQSLKHQLEASTRTTKRQRVNYCAQDTFATIVEIKTAQLAIGMVEAMDALPPPTAESVLPNQGICTASNVQDTTAFKNIQSIWQIDPSLQ